MLVLNDIAELLLVQVRNCMEQNEGGLNTHRSSLSQGAVFEKAFSHTSVSCASNLTLTFPSPARVGRSGSVREYYGQKRGGKSGLIPFPRCSSPHYHQTPRIPHSSVTVITCVMVSARVMC